MRRRPLLPTVDATSGVRRCAAAAQPMNVAPMMRDRDRQEPGPLSSPARQPSLWNLSRILSRVHSRWRYHDSNICSIPLTLRLVHSLSPARRASPAGIEPNHLQNAGQQCGSWSQRCSPRRLEYNPPGPAPVRKCRASTTARRAVLSGSSRIVREARNETWKACVPSTRAVARRRDT